MKTKQICIWVSVVSLMASALAGCGGKKDSLENGGAGNEAAVSKAAETDSAKTPVLRIAWSGGSSFLKEDDEKVHQYILDNAGIDIQVEFIIDDNYDEKMNLKFAGEEKLDAFRKIGIADSWVDLKEKGVIVPINEYVKKYPNIMEEFDGHFESAMDSEGNIWALPRYNQDVMYVPAVRSDWVEALGMEMPETLEDFEAYLEAVVTQDPNGNGQKDEIGFVPYWGMWGFYLGMRPAFLGVNGVDYINEKDEVVSIYKHPQFKGMLETLNKWYEKGWLYSEFETQSDDKKKELIESDRVGSFIGWWFGGGDLYNKGFQYAPLQPWKDAPGGIAGWGASAEYDPLICISSTSENPELYFQFLNWVLEAPENFLTCTYGMEGENWEWVDKEKGVYKTMEGQEDRYGLHYQAFSTAFHKYSYLSKEANTPAAKNEQEVKAEIAEYTKLPDTQNIWPFSYTGTDAEFLTSDANTMIDEAIMKIIYGQQDLDTWDAVVDQYMEMAGNTYQNVKTEQWRANFSNINPYAAIK